MNNFYLILRNKKAVYATFFFLQYATVMQAQVDTVKFGAGGGFSGGATTYKIYKKHLYKSEGQLMSTQNVKCSKLKRKDRKYIFKTAQEISLLNTNFNRPYNTYKFLELSGPGNRCEMTWGDPAFEVPDKIITFYNQLFKIAENYKLNLK